MTTTLRTEEWTTEVGWGVSTALVEVLEGEKVNVMPTIVKELGLSGKAYSDIVPTNKDYFAMQFDYADVREALIETGYSYAGTS